MLCLRMMSGVALYIGFSNSRCIIFCHVTIVDTVGVLEGYIEEYLWQVCQLHPNESGIPKMHSLVHLPIVYVEVSIYNIFTKLVISY